jgi:hypothetical protein
MRTTVDHLGARGVEQPVDDHTEPYDLVVLELPVSGNITSLTLCPPAPTACDSLHHLSVVGEVGLRGDPPVLVTGRFIANELVSGPHKGPHPG